MEERLRNGDGNLLSYLLATTTPATYQAYRQWQASQTETPSTGNNRPTS
jgi:hypothetical protein